MNTRRYRPLAVFATLTAGAGLAVAMLAGCAQTGTGGAGAPGAGGSAAPGTVAPSTSSTPGTGASGTPGAGSSGGLARSVPVASLTCGTSPATLPGPLPERSWTKVVSCPVRTVQVGPGGATGARPSPPAVARGDLGPLVDALNQPDAPRTSGMCPDYRVLLPTFWLVDTDGQAYQPRIPVNPCGQPSDAVLTALRDLGLT